MFSVLRELLHSSSFSIRSMLGHKLFLYDEESVLRVIKYFQSQISVSSAK